MNEKKMLEAAAKACGFGNGPFDFSPLTGWNPLTNGLDTAEMCAKLGIDTCFYLQLSRVTCDFYSGNDHIRVRVEFKDHDNSRMKAWMAAATLVAAKTQGYKDE